MVTCDFIGGMGNNMFQIAATIGAAKAHSHEYGFKAWKYNKYLASSLPILHAGNLRTVKEFAFTYYPIRIFTGNYCLNGYYQSEKYFDKCREEIRSVFTFDDKLRTKAHIDMVALHVRRGDYLKMPEHHTNLSMSYYYKAMACFAGARFLIFSDDIEWCKQQDWLGHDVYFSENKDAGQDMHDMSICSHNIIANSSFSWWAAWLNKRTGRKVIAPKNWFGHKLRHDTKDLIPEAWILL
jgi:hypothetical protein